MIGRSGERGSGISVLAAQHDDDDIYIYRERERERERGERKIDCLKCGACMYIIQ